VGRQTRHSKRRLHRLGGAEIQVDLTRREVDVLCRLVHGDSNAVIARHLHIREQTVKNHVSVLLQKLHARNRVQLAVLATMQWPELASDTQTRD
jgi:DNA-binding NarL/FixJ family response regulator